MIEIGEGGEVEEKVNGCLLVGLFVGEGKGEEEQGSRRAEGSLLIAGLRLIWRAGEREVVGDGDGANGMGRGELSAGPNHFFPLPLLAG